MRSFQKRFVDKVIADHLQQQIEMLDDPEIKGAGSIFAVLSNVVPLSDCDLKKVRRAMVAEVKSRKKSADLPDSWRDVRASVES